jgi:hypothetical protein
MNRTVLIERRLLVFSGQASFELHGQMRQGEDALFLQLCFFPEAFHFE